MGGTVHTPAPTATHWFRRDRELGYDRRGRAYCVCGLPESSARHRHRPAPPPGPDRLRLAAGDRDD